MMAGTRFRLVLSLRIFFSFLSIVLIHVLLNIHAQHLCGSGVQGEAIPPLQSDRREFGQVVVKAKVVCR